MLDTRAINEGVDKRREALMQEYLKLQNTPMRFRTLDDFDADPVDVKRWTEPDRRGTRTRYTMRRITA